MLSPFKKAVVCKAILALSHAQYTINPNQILELNISQEGMTRISVEGDGLDGVFIYPAEYSDQIQKHPAGHIFIVGKDISEPVYLTLITRSGLTQDLKLSAKRQEPEPILLKASAVEGRRETKEQQITQALKILLAGGTPEGFISVAPLESSRVRGPMEAIASHSYRSVDFYITEFTVKNTASKRLTLNPSLMWEEGDFAIVFAAEALEPSSETKMYSVQQLKGEEIHES